MNNFFTKISLQIKQFFSSIFERLTFENLINLILSILFFIFLFIAYKLIRKAIKKSHSNKFKDHQKAILLKILKYLFYFSTILLVLNLFGVKLSAIWGAAGIAGVAIGFASQTSISNLISGIFIISEGALKIGDSITIDEQTGIIDSINLLSIRIHTYDNQMIRIPNSKILDSNLQNNSFFPIRRITVNISIDYNEDLEKVLDILITLPLECELILKTPEPNAWFDSFSDANANFIVAAWCKTNDFVKAKNQLFLQISKGLKDTKINVLPKNLKIFLEK